MAGRNGGRTERAPNPRATCRSRGAITAGEARRFKEQYRDVGARALRAIFSSNDNWHSLSEAERDEWRGYFDRMVNWLRQFGCTPERNPWSMLLESSASVTDRCDEGA